jgi:hypothetical protein
MLRVPENKLLAEIHCKHPEVGVNTGTGLCQAADIACLMQARLEPLALHSFKSPLAKVFAVRQLALMKKKDGLSKDAAFMKAEKELAGPLEKLRRCASNRPCCALCLTQSQLPQQDTSRTRCRPVSLRPPARAGELGGGLAGVQQR